MIFTLEDNKMKESPNLISNIRGVILFLVSWSSIQKAFENSFSRICVVAPLLGVVLEIVRITDHLGTSSRLAPFC